MRNKFLVLTAVAVILNCPVLASNVWFDAGIPNYESWPSDGSDKTVDSAGVWRGTSSATLKGESGSRFLEISTSTDSALSFEIENARKIAKDPVSVHVSVRSSFLPMEDEIPVPEAGAKGALTIAKVLDTEEAAYFGLAKDPAGETNVWVRLIGSEPDAEKTFDLSFDIKSTDEGLWVRYSAGDSVLTDADENAWMPIVCGDASAAQVSVVDFSGSGEVGVLTGSLAEEVPSLELTIPEIDHASVRSVTANGITIKGTGGVYLVPQGAVVAVRFDPEDGFALTSSVMKFRVGEETMELPADGRPTAVSISAYITINEIMASNGSSLTTKSGVAGIDWVELYNSHDEDIDLSGYYFGNDPTKKTDKWKDFKIQGTCLVPAKGYKILWCDGDELCSDWAEDEAHVTCNVSTTAGKHTLFLAPSADPETILQQLTMPGMMKDVSYGLGHLERTLVAKNDWSDYRTSDGEWIRVRGPVGKSAGPADFTTTSVPAAGGLTTYTVEGSVRIPRAGLWSFAVDSDIAFKFALADTEDSFMIENDSTGSMLQQMSAFNLDAQIYTFRLTYTGAAGCTQPTVWVAEGDFTITESAGFNTDDFAKISFTAGEGALEHGGRFEGRLAAAVDAESFDWKSAFTLAELPAEGDTLTLDLETVGAVTVKLNGVVCDPAALDVSLLKKGANTLEIAVTAAGGESFLSAGLTLMSRGSAFVYFRESTPGKANTTHGYGAMTPEVSFSERHGYKTAPFELALSCADAPYAPIYYTLDGTSPTTESTLYTGPITISKTTCIRAAVPQDNTILQKDCAATYLYLDEILARGQDVTPEGFPADRSVNNHHLRYGLNQTVVNGADRERLLNGFTNSIATMSIVIDPKNLFDKQHGIYVNPSGDGKNWERQMMLEQFNPIGDAEGFSVPAGIRIRGAASRSTGYAKHSLRFFFRGEYGMGSLEYPLFEKEGADEFDKVDLRCSQNYSWANEGSPYDTFIHECFSRDSQSAMGEHYTRSRYYNLFINGQYWGLYMTQERGDQDFAESYNGGAADTYDVIKTSRSGGSYVTGVNEGTKDAWEALRQMTIEGFDGEHAGNYYKALGCDPDGSRNTDLPVLLNPTNLMVFIISAHYVCDGDSPNSAWGKFPNNLYALRDRVDTGNPRHDGFFYLRHDAEHSLGVTGTGSTTYSSYFKVTSDPTGYGLTENRDFGHFNPCHLHAALCKNPEYRRVFADVFHKHCLKAGGAMTAPVARARFEKRMAEIDDAIVGECARWSKNVDTCNRTQWLKVCNENCIAGFIEKRMPIMLSQYRTRGWYPSVDAATAVDGCGTPLLDGAQIAATDRLYLTGGGQGKVYYTTDGTDPRLADDTVSSSASEYTGGSPVPTDVPVFGKGAEWKYYDKGNKPADNWMAADFDDAAWASGNGKLGFASSGTFGTTLERYVGGGTSGTQVNAFYFRKKVTLPAIATALTTLKASLSCDDGYVLYINGQEVKRENISVGTVGYETTAETNMEDHDVDLTFAAGLLKEGDNVIAVEVHQCSSPTSSDAWWDLALSYQKAAESGNGLVVPPEGLEVTMRVLSESGEWSAMDTVAVRGEKPRAKVEGDGFLFCLTGEYDEPVEIAPTGDTCRVVLDGATVPGLTFLGAGDFAVVVSNENAVAALSASAAKVTVEGDGALRLEGANTLVSVLDLTVKSGTFAVRSTGVSATKTPVVNVLGSVRQTGGTIDLDLDVATPNQIYGIYVANKNMDAKFSGGTFAAKVGGTKSAAIYGEKGSVNPSFSGDVAVTAELTGPEARFVNAKGKLKLKGGTFAVTMPEDCASLADARVFKADEDIEISGGTISVNVPASGSEIFSSDAAILVSGGVLSLAAADDCFSATGDIEISGGIVHALSTAGDAIDSNGSVTISGGRVFAFTLSPDHDAIDVDPILTEESSPEHNLIIHDGATVVAVGGDQQYFHAPDAGSTATVYAEKGLASSRKYVELTGVLAGDSSKTTTVLSVNWNKRHADTFTLIATMPGYDGQGYAEAKDKPTDVYPNARKLNDNVDGVFLRETVEETAKAVKPGLVIEVTAATPEEAIERVTLEVEVPVSPVTGEPVVDEETYKGYFVLTATPVAGKEGSYSVEAVLNEAVVKPVIGTTDEIDTPFTIGKTGGEVAIKTLPGLYYSLVRGSEVGAIDSVRDCKLATGTTIDLADTEKLPNAAFYRIRVSSAAETLSE